MIAATLLFAASVMSAQEQPRMVVALLTPGDTRTIALSRLLDAIAPAIEDAGLSARSMEQVGVDGDQLAKCPATSRLSCWVDVVVGAAGSNHPRYLLVVSARTDDTGRMRTSAIAVDLAEAVRVAEAESDTNRLENALYAAALRLDERAVDPNERAVRAWFESVARTQLRTYLEARDDWRALGSIRVTNATPGAELAIDEIPIGTTTAPEATIRDVRAGRRRVTVRSANGASAHEVEVTAAKTADVVVVGPAPAPSADRWATLGVSAASVVAGTIAIAIAAAKAGQVQAACLSDEDPAGCERRAVTTGFDPGATPTTRAADVTAGGVPLAALGAGLVGLGVGAGATTAFTWDAHEPWWAALVGVGVGVASFFVTGLATGAF